MLNTAIGIQQRYCAKVKTCAKPQRYLKDYEITIVKPIFSCANSQRYYGRSFAGFISCGEG